MDVLCFQHNQIFEMCFFSDSKQETQKETNEQSNRQDSDISSTVEGSVQHLTLQGQVKNEKYLQV